MRIGSFESSSWNGIALIDEDFSFAFRFGCFFNGRIIDGGGEVYHRVTEVGPNAPDSSYARLGWNLSENNKLVLEWSADEASGWVVGKLQFKGRDLPINLFVEAYSPWHSKTTTFSISDSTICGFSSGQDFTLILHRTPFMSSTYSSLASLQGSLGRTKNLGPSDGNRCAAVQFRPFPPGESLYFAAACGKSEVLSWKPSQIEAQLRSSQKAYAQRRIKSFGVLEGAAEAIIQNMSWNNVYAKSTGRCFPSIDRAWNWGSWDIGGWTVGEWDCFFGSILTAIEDKRLTYDAIYGILSCTAPLGFVPNIASSRGISPDRSQPPVGSFAVWKNYLRLGDRELLERSYPALKRWHEWWFSKRENGIPYRDGNNNGLLEWGSERMGRDLWCGGSGSRIQAQWESGTDDSPMFDEAEYIEKTCTLNLETVCLNSYYALDAEMLSYIARELGKDEEASVFLRQRDEMARRINEMLWDEEDGIYKNRLWNGRFSNVLTPMNFYPLLAGVADESRANRMIKHLLDPDKFWGEYVIPTVSRSELSFTDQQYWRGNIWGPTNYLTYQGLKRYGFDEIAAEFAEKSVRLFMRNWERYATNNENFLVTGEGVAHRHYTWGTLLCLIGLEELIDVSPWDGLRFGSLGMEESSIVNVKIGKDVYEVSTTSQGLQLKRNARVIFSADSKAVIRHFVSENGLTSFQITVKNPVRITLPVKKASSVEVDERPSRFERVPSGIMLEVGSGKHSVRIRGS